MIVRYKGHAKKKLGMPVVLPVGLKSQGAIKRHGRVVFLNPTAELPDEDALKLVALDPLNYEIVDGEGVATTAATAEVDATELQLPASHEEEGAAEEVTHHELEPKPKKKSSHKKAGR